MDGVTTFQLQFLSWRWHVIPWIPVKGRHYCDRLCSDSCYRELIISSYNSIAGPMLLCSTYSRSEPPCRLSAAAAVVMAGDSRTFGPNRDG